MEEDKKISELPLAAALDGKELVPFAKGGENGAVSAQTLKEFAQNGIADLTARLDTVETDLSLAMGAALSGFAVGAWNPNNLAPEMSEFRGEREFLKDWHWWLIDTTDNEEVVTHPIGELNPVNLLRFKDGRFAPTIGITAAQKAECDVALYLDAAATQLYSLAGEFDSTAFYNEHGMAKLYDADGNEVRVLRPWETTETKYTIGVSHRKTIYLLDNVTGKSGKSWRGIFSKPIKWDGIDVSDYALPPTAISPSKITTIDNKARCFFYAYEGETNCKSSKGQDNSCSIFDNGRTYARVIDITLTTLPPKARANNADVNAPYPCAEGGYHALNSYITAMEVLHGTKALAAAAMFGSGISNNDSCNNETNWRNNGGVRYKTGDATEWSYNSYGQQPNIAYNTDGAKTNWSMWLNSEYPKEQCMESQMAYSFAQEAGIAENEEFDFYGATYRYVRVPGTDDDSMNVRVYKVMSGEFSAYNLEGNKTRVTVEVNLRMSLIGGVSLSGDIFSYWSGGYEQVGYVDHNPETNRAGFSVEVFAQPDQLKWHKIATEVTGENAEFGFESTYFNVGTFTTVGDDWCRKRPPYTNINEVRGGNSTTGECFYRYDNNNWGSVIGRKYRIGTRFGGYASHNTAAPRTAACNTRIPFRYFGGSAQFLVDTTMAQGLQAQDAV